MKEKRKMVVLAQITMNAGDDIPGSIIKWNLKKNFEYFDRILVVDGHLTKEAKDFYEQFKNVEVIDSPWKDSYVAQYEAFADKLQEGEWCLYLDCDETPSKELVNLMHYVARGYTNIVRIPCILHITEDNQKYYPVEPRPSLRYEGQWTKNILFQKNDGLYFRHFGSHVIPENRHGNYDYIHAPYFHMKSLESFAYNDVWQAYLSPEGQGYTPTEAALFRMLTKRYKATQEFKEATKQGKWTAPLMKFASQHSKDFDRPISRLSWVYYLLEKHVYMDSNSNMRGPEGALTWDYVKQYVLSKASMDRLNENKNKGNFIEVC